jgi:flagellar protein FlaJ|tara:strand:+ start:198 stop:1472 length:1275 start_codon:yes stop_codon:yes gene_type:complete
MFEDLKNNINQEKRIIMDMNSIRAGMGGDKEHHSYYMICLDSLSHQLRMLNSAVPELLGEWSPIKKFKEESDKGKKNDGGISEKKTVKMSYVSPLTKEKKIIVINKEDRKDFLKKLKLSEANLKSIKKLKVEKEDDLEKKPNYFAGVSNKFFRETSEKFVPTFGKLNKDLKKSNIRFLTSTYISMAIFSLAIGLVTGLLIFGGLLFYSLSNWIYIWIPFAILGIIFLGFYFYPSSESNNVNKRVSQELPFATIHMAAIAGSDIGPTKIFKIIAFSKEYPYMGFEMKKVLTQIELYGYDIVTALKNVSSKTSNLKLGELFSGIATDIGTGGELKNYLEKKAENFLIDYRLERQRYSELAGTFMDIYISILIAAPLVLMMMFIVMNAVGLEVAGLGIEVLLVMSVGVIILVNIIFLFVLNTKQPTV